MIESVLVPVDGSELAEQALEHAIETYPEASITVLTVVGGPSPMLGERTGLALAEDPQGAAADLAAAVTDRVREIAAEHDRAVDIRVAVGKPSQRILERAADHDLVVIGSHGGSLLDRLMVGNVAETIIRRSPVPITVMR